MNHAVDTQFWEFSNDRGWVVRNRVVSSEPCPLCSGVLYRAPRRLVDRLFSLRQQRFQCVSPACYWEGDLSIDRALPASSGI